MLWTSHWLEYPFSECPVEIHTRINTSKCILVGDFYYLKAESVNLVLLEYWPTLLVESNGQGNKRKALWAVLRTGYCAI